jgi:hypothetical protein
MSEQPCAQQLGTVGDIDERSAMGRGHTGSRAGDLHVGYRPQRSWRDYLEEDGAARAGGSLPAQARSGTAS